MRGHIPAHLFLTFVMLLSAACSAEDGLVIVDLCTPAEAADPLQDGMRLRMESYGDIQTSVTFDLVEGHTYDQTAAFPMGSEIRLTVDVLNAGDVPIARGRTEEVTVRSTTRVCACMTRLQQDEVQLCEGIGCVYEADDDRCVFYQLPQ